MTVTNEENEVKEIIKSKRLSEKMLTINNLCRLFWNMGNYCRSSMSGLEFDYKIKAVNNVSFTVNHGECFGLVGENGAGKSTIFKILTGTLVPSHGQAYVRSVSLLNPYRRRKVRILKIRRCVRVVKKNFCIVGDI